jgi:hypothetical protein
MPRMNDRNAVWYFHRSLIISVLINTLAFAI